MLSDIQIREHASFMDVPLRPIYLFADSQLLFWKENDEPFLESVRLQVKRDNPRAAYIGASNGDVPDFYSIFEGAMEGVGINDCRMIRSAGGSLSPDDLAFLHQADIILLAGGDVEKGWQRFQQTGLNELLVQRYYQGAVLIGTSAGAVQLGLYGCVQRAESFTEIFETLKLVPFLIDVHGEDEDWARLRQTIGLLDTGVKGIGIPAGGGAIYHPDQTLEPIRHPLYEYSVADGGITAGMLLPPL
jgi:peptidase E